jgi:lysophospholipase L1-like esterase
MCKADASIRRVPASSSSASTLHLRSNSALGSCVQVKPELRKERFSTAACTDIELSRLALWDATLERSIIFPCRSPKYVSSSKLLVVLLGIVLVLSALLVSSCSTKETNNIPWKYVALGDSFAEGSGADRGYVDRYADYIKADAGAQVNVINRGLGGETSSQLLYTLRNDSSIRQTLSAADVITFNVGLNDLEQAAQAYNDGNCSENDNQGCLHNAVNKFKGNWDAIVAEILSLRSTSNTIIRTTGTGYTPNVFYSEQSTNPWPNSGWLNDPQALRPYVDEINDYIAITAAKNNIPYAQVYLDKEDISQDGEHPNDKGYEVIAGELRKLGYSPLEPAG